MTKIGMGATMYMMALESGTIFVTAEEFGRLSSIMVGEDDVSEVKAACELLGLNPQDVAFRNWKIQVVDKVEERIEFIHEELKEQTKTEETLPRRR